MSTAGQTRRAERRARRKERRRSRREKRQERRAARREAGTDLRSRIWGKDSDEATPGKPEATPQTPIRIPGPGPMGTDWGGTPAAPGAVTTMTGAWWMDPKVLLLGAAAVFILMRPKKAS